MSFFVKKEEVKEEPKVDTLPSKMYLKSDAFVYKDADEKTQKTWLLKKNTELSVIAENGEWAQISDAEKHRGWVKKEVLVDKP